MGSRGNLLPRWYSSVGDISVVLRLLRDVLPDSPAPQGRGRPFKHAPKLYLTLIVVKELKRSSLRSAETDWSARVCGTRVDHSVLHWWENRLPREVVEQAVRLLGKRIEQELGYEFTVIDATSFTTWTKRLVGFHLLTRIARGTVYPASMKPDSLDPIPNTTDTLVPGAGRLLADRWYDVNHVYKAVYKAGYTPLIKPKRNAGRGRWRRKGNRLFALEWRFYRQRGRGESPFGSLTNAFGDRLPTRLKKTTYVRSGARVLAYQVKILVRIRGSVVWIIVRHARWLTGRLLPEEVQSLILLLVHQELEQGLEHQGIQALLSQVLLQEGFA